MNRVSLTPPKGHIFWNVFSWFIFTLIGILIPTFLGLIILRYFNLFESWSTLFLNGEFAIYSNSLLIYTIYVATKNYTEFPFNSRPIFVALPIVGLFFSLTIYCGVIFSSMAKELYIADSNFLIRSTIILFVSSMTISLVANLIEYTRSYRYSAEDLKKAKDEGYNKFEKEFEKGKK